ncbi:MAG: hypothetical protein ACLF0P_08550 [Thermoanaerobaculia bacterium]
MTVLHRRRSLLFGLLLLSSASVQAAPDPAGDTVARNPGEPDAITITAQEGQEAVHLTLELAAPDPTLSAIIELDTDASLETGDVSRVSLLCPDLTGLGVDRRIEVPAAGSVAVVTGPGGAVIGNGSVTRAGAWLTVTVPKGALGGSVIGRPYAAVVGGSEASDCLPNGGAAPVVDAGAGDPLAIPALDTLGLWLMAGLLGLAAMMFLRDPAAEQVTVASGTSLGRR